MKDEEIRNLSEYFKNSREEIQKVCYNFLNSVLKVFKIKKVNSLLNFDFSASKARNMTKSDSSASIKSDNGKSITKNFRQIDFQTAIVNFISKFKFFF